MEKNLEGIITTLKSKRIAVIGDVMLDIFYRGVIERVNPDDEGMPLLRIGKKEREKTLETPGGAANVALNVIPYAQCDFFGIVGDDDAGKKIVDYLKSNHINEKVII